MPISEAARSDLYHGLSDVLGPERAETLMSAIPLHDLDEVATKGDLAELRSEMKVEIAGVRSELAELRSEINSELAELRSELRSENARLRSDFTSQMADLRKSMTTWFVAMATTTVGAMAAVLVVALQVS